MISLRPHSAFNYDILFTFLFPFSFTPVPLALSFCHSLSNVSPAGGFITVYLSPQVSFFLFIVFVVYTMLPFSMRDAIIASVLTSASHTLVLSICLSTTADHMEPVVWQVKQNQREREVQQAECWL